MKRTAADKDWVELNKKYPMATVRLGEVADEVYKRVAKRESVSSIVKRDLCRYYKQLAIARKEVGIDKKDWIGMANWYGRMGGNVSLELLVVGVDAEAKKGRDISDAGVKQLGRLTAFELLAVLDGLELMNMGVMVDELGLSS